MKRWLLACALAVGGVGGAARVAAAEPPETHEIIYNRPSGFWTSNRPAVGGAYKYRLMLIGLGVLGITGFFTMRLIRNARPRR